MSHTMPTDDTSDRTIDMLDEGVAPLPIAPDFTKLDEFSLRIEGGVLENLGIKMYSNVGKVLVEFAANAFDSDSPSVDIMFDAERIVAARDIVLVAARERMLKERASASFASRDRKPKRKAHVVDDPLPEDVTIVIKDRGHGMTPTDMASMFLPLNRNRRKTDTAGEEDNFYSEAGKRLVMGRKGIGKLSAFGVAQKMTVRTKRRDQDYWTVVTLDSAQLKGASNIADITIPHEYVSAVDPEEHGTVITLSGLRCDAANFTQDEINAVLNETYYPIQSEEFDIRVNGSTVPKTGPELTYWYPENVEETGYAEDTITGEDWGELTFKYRVQFRKVRLDASKRGAYVYAKKRLAMSPTMLSLTTGMHNFMASQYMECIVMADDIDNLNIDVIGTNRTDIIQNSDLVKTFRARLEEIMTEAIKANSHFKDAQADDVIDKAKETEELRKILSVVHGKQRANARALAKTFLKNYPVDSDEFKHLTPLIIGAANAGEILIDLIKVSNTAETVAQIAPALIELRQIERTDAFKIYQGRRRGIVGLQRIVDKSFQKLGKGPHDENELHRLLKAQPWLIRPDLTGYMSSDEGMSTVLDRLAQRLEIGQYAKPAEAEELIVLDDDDDATISRKTVRPDLVGLVGNGAHPDHVFVVELKAPTVPMRIEHLNQLKQYMWEVEDFLGTEYHGRKNRIRVEGVLIGSMPKDDTKSRPSKNLLHEMAKQQTIDGYWEVIGLNEMLRRTERVHSEMLNALKTAEEEEASLPDETDIPVFAESAQGPMPVDPDSEG